MGTMREEVYERLHPFFEQLVDIACEQAELMETDTLSEPSNYDGELENHIPVSIAKQIAKGEGLGGILGYMEGVSD